MRSSKVIIAAALASVAAACGKRAAPRGVPIAYHCADGTELTAAFTTQRPLEADLTLGGKEYRLPRTPSGSGARFSDGKTVFWTKGNDAKLEIEGRAVSCTTEETGAPS